MKAALRMLVTVVLVGTLAACGSSQRDTPQPLAGPSFLISDQTHHDGTHGFFFLFPMVPPAAYGPSFKSGLKPVVTIEELPPGTRGLIATYTATSGPYGGKVFELGESYNVFWPTAPFNLNPAYMYRIRVSVGGLELGLADVDVVKRIKELLTVDTGEYVPMLDDFILPIRFRIEPEAVSPDRCKGVVCAPLDQCHVAGVCDSATGTCSNPNVADGTPCNDRNACTQADACVAGSCVGAVSPGCTAPTAPTMGTPSVADGGNPGSPPGCAPGQLCVTVTWTSGGNVDHFTLYRRVQGGSFGSPLLTSLTGTNALDNTVAPDTIYEYAVTATNAAGTSDFSSPASVTTLPATFGTLDAVPSTDASTPAAARRITVTWTLPSGSKATGVWIYRAVTGTGFDFAAPIAANASSPYVDSTVLPDASYDYVARPGIAGVGVSSANSNVVTGKLTLPAEPIVSFSGTTSATGAQCSTPSCITLSWPALPTDVLAYSVTASDTGIAGSYWPLPGVASCLSGVCAFVDQGLPNGHVRYYKVAGINSTGTGPPGGIVPASTPPGPPSGVVVLGGVGRILLDWNTPAGATQFKVTRRLSSSGDAFAGSAIVVAPPCTDAGTGPGTCSLGTLQDGRTYDYQITSQTVLTGGVAIDGGTAEASGPVAPSTPTGLSAVPSAPGSVTLSWTSSTCATSYDIYQSSSNAPGSYLLAFPPSASGLPYPCGTNGSVTATIFGGLSSGASYWFQVIARNSGSTGDAAGASLPTHGVQVTLPPAAPTALTAIAGDAWVDLAWSGSSGAVNYSVLRGGAVIASGLTVTSYRDSNVANGTPYTYTVTAVNAGGTSAESNPVTATPTVPDIPRPANPAAIGLNAGVRVLWDAAAEASDYTVFQRSGAGQGTGEVAVVSCSRVTGGSGPRRSCSINGLTNHASFYFVVRAHQGVSSSLDSDEVTASPARELCVSLPEMGAVVAIDADSAPGTEVTPRRWFGNVTQLAQPVAVAVDAVRDEIFVVNTASDSVTVYGPRAGVAGNQAPKRTLTGLATTLIAPLSLAVDVAAQELFVANGPGMKTLAVFHETDSGAVAPKRQLTDTLAAINGVALGPAANEVTVIDGRRVMVYPRSWSGNSPATLRIFQVTVGSALQTTLAAVAVDPEHNEIWLGSSALVMAIDGTTGELRRAFNTSSADLLPSVGMPDVLSLAYDPYSAEVIVGTVFNELQGYPRLSGDATGGLVGTPSYSLSSSGTPASLLAQPRSIAVDGTNVVVANYAYDEPFQQGVATYRRRANDGDVLPALVRELYGPFQSYDPQMAADAPRGLASAPWEDLLWVANQGVPGGSSSSADSTDNAYAMTDAILTSSPTALTIRNGAGRKGRGIAFNEPDDEVYVSSSTTVEAFNAGTGVATGATIGGLAGANGLFLDASGNRTLLVAETTGGFGTGQISLWYRTPSGAFAPGAGIIDGNIVRPVGVWLAIPSGGGASKIWVANSGIVSGQLGPGAARFNASTREFEALYSLPGTSGTPTAIIADQAHVYVGTNSENHPNRVHVLTNVFAGDPKLAGWLQIAGVTHAVGGLAWCN